LGDYSRRIGRVRKAVLLGLVVVLALAAIGVAGCGGGGTSNAAATAAVQASLTKINAAIADMTAKGTSGSLTVAQIKSTRDSIKPEIQSVIDNGAKIKGVDTAALQKAWTDLDGAVTTLPDTATLVDAAGILITKVGPLQAALTAIQKMVTPST
jgi:hypothetical protein